ncbi:MAG: AI-2E family transporter [Epsilonproteobacteria bacterium]|nr:AI-2E family transporter [Campylobacterota bacterium]NPA65012.1 AI-2E family transporter [Campylobacterota bacterium]
MRPIHFLGILIVIVGYFLIKVFQPFLGTITIAVLLALATYKIHKYFLQRLPGKILPAFVSTLILGVIFFAPLIYIITNAASFVAGIDFGVLSQTIENTKAWLGEFIRSHEIFSNQNFNDFTAQIDINSIVNWIIQTATFLGKKSAAFLKDILLILIFYFFANLYGKEILLYFQRIIPLKKEDSETIFENLAGVMGVVFNSIIATAIFEGILFGIIAQYYGYNGLMFGILYGFASLIPVVGGVLMWLPLSLDRYFAGDTTGALVIAIYSIVVISIIADTFIKPIIIRYIDEWMIEEEHIQINELLIFFSIVAGLSSYGFWGMIIGPAVITLMISILNLYPKLANSR